MTLITLHSLAHTRWSRHVLGAYGDQGGRKGLSFHTQAESFGTEQGNLQMRADSLLNENTKPIRLERVPQ